MRIVMEEVSAHISAHNNQPLPHTLYLFQMSRRYITIIAVIYTKQTNKQINERTNDELYKEVDPLKIEYIMQQSNCVKGSRHMTYAR